MYILLEFSSPQDVKLMSKYFELGLYSSLLHRINLASKELYETHYIMRFRNGKAESYNPYEVSGYNAVDDWSVVYNTPIYTIDQLINEHPHLLI